MSDKKTPLYDIHVASGAKIIEFGGWLMPVQYTGIIEEHRAVRQAAGLFDVSHMGEVSVSGPDATAYVNRLVTNDASRLAVNQVMYTPMCYDHGGVVDDLLVYRLGEQEYLLVINAANIDKDYAWMVQHAANYDVTVKNISDVTAELALQGPRAEAILQPLTDEDLSTIKYYWLRRHVRVDGIDCLISRTGYTGEDGFEIYCAPEEAGRLWNRLMEVGKPLGLVPAGLGARDTLRFEAGLPLYGHELSESITPLEAGLGVFVKFDKQSFIGYEALLAQKNAGVRRKIVGIEMVGRGIARAGYACHAADRVIGTVTSGTYAPTLDKNLALAILETEFSAPGTEVAVEIRGKLVEAKVVAKPFYKRRK
ncbi:glycine cleavage system aminomethyltransferase GcvT [Sporolituus thermophilus]|uniref:Aminomethyltransferase n=1 Tax=Sporolituus thermophilus DSM 23256 TaxID=1123285 RepID=A0A1G7KF71_9FIRM|nr:glycine cleavage system aminomethyltransferase GcvT [Sporolituus thermophilus]SDF35837.1 aminomethyltransferase [Sporolituus thermophilus DSM 23256]